MKLHDLNTMEAEFLEAIGYGLFIKEYEFDQWRRAVDGCRQHVQRMALDGADNSLMRDALMRLGLFQDATMLEQQQHAVWESAYEASRLQLENSQRQHHLNLYAKAHSLVPLRPQRHTAPPPPISRYGDPPFHYARRRSSNPPGLPAEPMYKKQLPPPGLNTSWHFEYRPFEPAASWSSQDYLL